MTRKKRFHIVSEKVESYIKETIQPFGGFLEEVRKAAVEDGIPTMAIESARLLEIMICINKPRRVLEIGTASGFTAMLMADGMDKSGEIDTIEIDAEIAFEAKENFKKAGLTDCINIIVGDASDVLKNMDKTYDFVFIDAAKGQYGQYYDLCSDMVSQGGIIFADNVLYRGMTAGGAPVNRRQQLLVRRLRAFLTTVADDSRFISDILPVGDGICISYRK